MHMCGLHGHQVVALANLLPPDSSIDELDSYMYQTVGHQLVAAYAACTGLPLYRRSIHGSSTHQGLSYSTTAGDEVEDLFLLLAFIKQQHPDIQAVASGAIASDYQRLRVESVCSRLGLVSLGYLWHQPQDQLLSDMIANNIEAILVKVAAIGLDPYRHLGKSLRQMQPLLRTLRDRFGCNVCGEGGEYETLTLDCPAFKYGRIVLDDWKVVLHSPDSIAAVGVLHPVAFHIEPKQPAEEAHQSSNLTQQSQQQRQQPDGQSPAVIEVPDCWQPCKACEDCAAHNAAAAAAAAWDITIGVTVSASQVHLTCSATAKDSSKAAAAAASTLTGADTAAALESSLLALTARLPELGLSWGHSCFVHLYLADMSHFGTANEVYCKHLPQVDPPSRACVQVPLPQCCPVLLDVLFSAPACQATVGTQQQQQQTHDRRVLHVQSISCWAPSCIGPYSQATCCNGLIYMAGQIPLDPASMTIAPPSANGLAATIAAQTWRTLCSCQSVAVAVRSCFATAAVGLTVYLSEACAVASGQEIVQAALEAAWAEPGLLNCLQIPAAVTQAASAVAAAKCRGSDHAGAGETREIRAAAEAALCSSAQDVSCLGDSDNEEEGSTQLIDDYLKPPAVDCPLKPAVVYITVPALPRGALLEVQPVLKDMAAVQPPVSSSSSSVSDYEQDDAGAAVTRVLAMQSGASADAPTAAGMQAAGDAAAGVLHVASDSGSSSNTGNWQRVLVHLPCGSAAEGSSSVGRSQQAVAAARQLEAAIRQQCCSKDNADVLLQICMMRCWYVCRAEENQHDSAWQHALVSAVQEALSSRQQQLAMQFVPVSSVGSSVHLGTCWAVVEAYTAPSEN